MNAVIRIDRERYGYAVYVDGDVDSNLEEPAATFDDFFGYDDCPTGDVVATQRRANYYASKLQRKFGMIDIVRNY